MGGRVTAIESTASLGDATPSHVYDEMAEAFYILEGDYTVASSSVSRRILLIQAAWVDHLRRANSA